MNYIIIQQLEVVHLPLKFNEAVTRGDKNSVSIIIDLHVATNSEIAKKQSQPIIHAQVTVRYPKARLS